jgi:hypothetical protein
MFGYKSPFVAVKSFPKSSWFGISRYVPSYYPPVYFISKLRDAISGKVVFKGVK